MENPYQFDLDKNGMLAITQKNISFMEGILNNDSNYRRSRDYEYENYSYSFIKKTGITQDYDILLEQIKRIDNENSTHLSVSSRQKGFNSNKGREITALFISQIPELKKRLVDGDGTLVNEISQAVPNRNNFSFASKFCTYMTEFTLTQNNNLYCIFDDVVSKILPYYTWIYLGKNFVARKNSTIKKVFMDNVDYIGYRNLINKIIDKIKKINNINISYRQFDNLLWYYYKGDDIRIQKALSHVKNISSKL